MQLRFLLAILRNEHVTALVQILIQNRQFITLRFDRGDLLLQLSIGGDDFGCFLDIVSK